MKHLLVVDDNVAMLRLYEFHLRNNGWDGHYFSSGLDAIKALESFQPDAAILDYDLKEMVGTDVHAVMQRLYPDKKIPVIFITAQIRADIRKSLREIEGASILAKPFSPALLVKAIKELFKEA